MSMSELLQAFDLAEANSGDADFDGPKDEKLIRSAEQALGLSFPTTYREFLLRLGCGDIMGLEFYGVINGDFENSSIPDAIWLTLDQRKSSSLPLNLVLIAETGEGGYYALDIQETSTEESEVVEWTPGTGASLESVSSDYGAFFLERITSVVA